jgi:6-pyruvoyl tetrahydropterin synthase/QueD family protein
MQKQFNVRVEGVKFDAAHFATFEGKCEPLHGHSYEVAAEVEGALTEDSWVVNFVQLKSLLRRLCKDLDHRFMLQADSRVLEIDPTESHWKVRTPSGVGYVLPRQDVISLPIDNTTAERLAEWLSGRVWQSLEEGGARLHSLALEVWEGPGQRASHRMDRLPLD